MQQSNRTFFILVLTALVAFTVLSSFSDVVQGETSGPSEELTVRPRLQASKGEVGTITQPLTEGETFTLTVSGLGGFTDKRVYFGEHPSNPFLIGTMNPPFDVSPPERPLEERCSSYDAGGYCSCVVSGDGCTVDIQAPGPDQAFYWAQIDLDGDLFPDSEDLSNYIEVSITSCDKTFTPQRLTLGVPVETVVGASAGTKSCTVYMDQLGLDVSDSSAVGYKTVSSTATSIIVEMDDQPPGDGDCDNDLTWENEGTYDPAPSWNFWTTVTLPPDPYDAGNDLKYGYDLNVPADNRQCRMIESLIGVVAVEDQPYLEITSSSETYFQIMALYSNNESDGRVDNLWGTNHEFVECTINAHCTPGSGSENIDAVSAKSTCNLGNTANFPQNTCIDSVMPRAKIVGMSSGGVSASTAGQTIVGYRDGTKAFLRANADQTNRTYTVAIRYKDNQGDGFDSGLSRCYLQIKNGGTNVYDPPGISQACSGTDVVKTFDITVGPTGQCATEQDNNCVLLVYGEDLAGNQQFSLGGPSLTAPSDEKNYLDTDGEPYGDVNIFEFGVDYTPPN